MLLFTFCLSLYQLIEAELKAKENVYNHFMKDVDSDPKTRPDIETESQFNEEEREGLSSPTSLAIPVVEGLEFNPQQGVNYKSIDRRRRLFEVVAGMESVQEQSGEEDAENGTETPRIPELNKDSNKSTPPDNSAATATTPRTKFDWSWNQHSMEDSPKQSRKLPKQPYSLPIFLTQASLPNATPPSSLHHSSTQSSLQHTPTQNSLLSSLSSLDYGPRALLSRQVIYIQSMQYFLQVEEKQEINSFKETPKKHQRDWSCGKGDNLPPSPPPLIEH